MNVGYTFRAALFLTGGLSVSHAQADFSDLFGSFSNELEEQSARAVYRTYQRLLLEENCVDGIIDKPPVVEGGSEGGPPKLPCDGRAAQIFANIQKLIHTGNALANDGPTSEGLELDRAGLGSALRWVAAEEYAAQGDMSKNFIDGQVSSLSSRLSALRGGASGFQFSYNGVWLPNNYAHSGTQFGGSAGVSDSYSRLGGFLNVQTGKGSRDATGLEDAYDFDGFALSAGVDYRLTDNWTLGALLGLSDQEMVFDEKQSVVEGSIGSNGNSIMPFVAYQHGDLYVSTSLTLQSLSVDSERGVRIDPTSATLSTNTKSSSDANTQSFFSELGYTFRQGKLSVEPFISYTYTYTKIDEFKERDLNNLGFDLTIKEQTQEAKDLSLGAKLQYVFTPSFGVIIPSLAVQNTSQLEDSPRNVEAYYDGLSRSDSLFFIPVEEVDKRYNTITLGVSSVIRGGRELTPGGKVGGDIQAHASIKTITGLQGFDLYFYTVGVRYAF